MKKYILFFMCMLAALSASAQKMVNYNFSAIQGTYTELSDATVIKKYSETDELDIDKVAYVGIGDARTGTFEASGMAIGFDFMYNETKMTNFVVGAPMYIVLGNDKISFDPTAATSDIANAIVNRPNGGLKAQAGSEISYKLQGEAGSRILTVQYKNMVFDNWGTAICSTASFQIKLYEGTNNIEMCYHGWELEQSNFFFISNGLRGSDKDDILYLTGKWDEPTVTEKNENHKFSIDSKPSDGLTYLFSYPEPCQTPASQPTDLVLTAGSDNISGSFTAIPDSRYFYLVTVGKEQNPQSMPADGTHYKIGDKIGNMTVIAYSNETEFATADDLRLDGATKYYVNVFATAERCSNGPKYNTTAPLSAGITTKPEAPASIKVTTVGYTEIGLATEADKSGNDIIVAHTIEAGLDINHNQKLYGLFGQPTAELNVGDNIEGGGKIIFKGAASDFEASNMEDNTFNRFRAWSVDAEGNVSTTFVDTYAYTKGKVPYVADFSKLPIMEFSVPEEHIPGWTFTGEEMRLQGGKSYGNKQELFNARISQSAEGKSNSFETQWIKLAEGVDNRVLLDYNMIYYYGFGGQKAPYNEWKEGDRLTIEITKDDISFETIAEITSDNHKEQATAADYIRIYAPFKQYQGEEVRIRVTWTCFGNMDISIGHFEVEECRPCDYPIDVAVSEIEMDKALVGWKAQGEESEWEIRWRTAKSEEWIYVDVKSNPAAVSGLPGLSSIEIEVRAKCSSTEHSLWSKKVTFTSGYTLPFTENFKTLNAGWEFRQGKIADPTLFCSDNCRPMWNFGRIGRLEMLNFTNSSGRTNVEDWLLFPKIDFGDGDVNYILSLDLYVISGNKTACEKYHIVKSDADGEFTSDNVIHTIEHADLPTSGQKTFNVPLKGVSGTTRLAIYVEAATGDVTQMGVTKIAVVPTCPNDAVITIGEITENSAAFTWTGTKDPDQKWKIFVRKAGSAEKLYTDIEQAEYTATGLDPRTTYEFGVTKACAADDIAKPVIATFTTLAAEECELPENVGVTASQYTAEISWTGNGIAYFVRYRLKGTDTWTEKRVVGNSFQISGLTPEATYEFAVRKVCSQAEGDMSAYTETQEFSTLAVTCFTPENMQVTPTHKSILVKWSGVADNYEVAFRKGEEAWTVSKTADKEMLIEDIEAETLYSVRVRSFCSESEQSLWTEIMTVKTLAIPECVIPSELKAEEITDNSIKATWKADESNLSWDFRYREGEGEFIEVKDLTETSYTMKDLKAKTVYLWSVKAHCDEGRESAYSANTRTSTTENTAVEYLKEKSLEVYLTDNYINIINTYKLFISEVSVYTVDGTLAVRYAVNGYDNVIVPVGLTGTTLVVKINTEGKILTYKVM